MTQVKITIDGKEILANEGETVLNTARANGVFIPALCYLTGCSPILACRLCMVNSDDKLIYACNSKVKDGMNITTQADDLVENRKSIMQVYDLNHPLECGVCDKSGECDLQNYTHYTEVDSQVNSIPDVPRPHKKFNDDISYNASLCITCERCITVCEDSVGESALTTVPRGGEEVDKELKETMNKEVFAMYKKLQKSLIGPKNEDFLNCTSCGECINVCPVGALVSSKFEYTSNSWELQKIPASNPHSSDCELIYYEVKHDFTKSNNKKIYRVTNDEGFSLPHGTARFGFDFVNESLKDPEKLQLAVKAFKKADTIIFNSFITNEEAYILQKLKEKNGYKLINHEALRYQKFLNHFCHLVYDGSLYDVQKSDFVIVAGSHITHDHPRSGYAFNKALSMNKGAGIYFHPIKNTIVSGYTKAKSLECIQNEPGSEEAILVYILKQFTKNTSSIVLDLVKDYDFSSLNIPPEFDAKLEKMLENKEKFSLILGEDFYTHPNAPHLAFLAGEIQRCSNFDLVLIPPQTNSLGVALLCDLDEVAGVYSIGYNEKADFVLSSYGDGDFELPALHQQEGTFVNINTSLVPTNVGVKFDGYELNDLANALGVKSKYTIDYTHKFPANKGFKPIKFDDLANEFKNDGRENRGYQLKGHCSVTCAIPEKKSHENLYDKNSSYIYRANSIRGFGKLSAKSQNLNLESGVFGSVEFLETNGFQNADEVELKINDHELCTKIYLDDKIEGMIPYITDFDDALPTQSIFEGKYRFQKFSIQKGMNDE